MAILFFLLATFTPVIFLPYTSELFEFNKIVFVYLVTILVTTTWIIKIILRKKIIIRRTILDIPLLIFLATQIISTITSIDPVTSILGYYSRFNGSLLSTACYLLLYWAYVANVNAKQTKFIIKGLVTSALVVSLYGILQHIGIDKNYWVQDVQNRVFSTLGQPNWLAALLVTVMPLTGIYSPILFLCLLFTKSRSGLLGFAVADLIYGYFNRFKKPYLVINLIFLVLFLATLKPVQKNIDTGEGGTESGTIRRYVWEGAITTWKHYPIVGSGVETFAYSFYQFRPQAHNLTSEWDFLYNKAHNEYLNYLATCGLLGFGAYINLIIFSLFTLRKTPAFLAGYIGLLVTNFFGFSVVTTSLLFFLYPAMALKLHEAK